MERIIAAGGAFCCIALGLYAARRLREREKSLGLWEEAMIFLSQAVSRGGLPLADLMEEGKTDSLKRAAALIRQNPALSAEELIQSLSPDPFLTDPEWQAVCALIRGLFSPHREGQLAAIRHAGDQFARYAALFREAAEKNIRLYRNLGWLAGAAVLILIG